MWFLLPEQVLHYLSLYSFHWFNFTYLLCPCIHRGSRLLPLFLSPPMTRLDITIALYFLITMSATLYFISTWICSYRYDIVELPNSSSILVPGILNLMWWTSKWLIDRNLGRWWAVMDLGEKNEPFLTNFKLKFIISFQCGWRQQNIVLEVAYDLVKSKQR